MKIHKLKIEEHYLDDLVSGEKTFEIRWNDRNYQKGDLLQLERRGYVNPFEFEILSVFSGNESFGLKDGFVILSVKRVVR